MIHDTKRIRIRQSRNETNLLKSGFVIHNTVRIHGFAKRIHVFTNLLYESRNLSFDVLIKVIYLCFVLKGLTSHVLLYIALVIALQCWQCDVTHVSKQQCNVFNSMLANINAMFSVQY